MQPVRLPIVAQSLDSAMQRFWHQRLSKIAEQSSRRWLSWLLLEVRSHLISHLCQLIVCGTQDRYIALGLVGHVTTFYASGLDSTLLESPWHGRLFR